MAAGIVICVVYVAIIWLVFFKLKWMKFSIGWGFISGLVGLHLLLIFLIGLRFVTPYSTNATVIQRTIQLIPRLPEPTLVTDVLVEEGAPVKKGQPLFQLDRRPYEYQVQQLEAKLVEAKQNVKVLRADMEAATQKVTRLSAELNFEENQQAMYDRLTHEHAAPKEDVLKYAMRVASAQASEKEALAELDRARLKYESEIGGVNTTVASVEAQLRLARYYLDNTLMVAPEDGRIINLQVRPGMVSGIVRVGGIAAFLVDADRYVLATFYQENLKYVERGQPVEVALDLYPGQIFVGEVDGIWKGNGLGQYLPTDEVPKFHPRDPNLPQGQYAVKIILHDMDQSKFPIGAQGAAAIYTSGYGTGGAWAALRMISIRTRAWLSWLYPL